MNVIQALVLLCGAMLVLLGAVLLAWPAGLVVVGVFMIAAVADLRR